MMEAARFPKLTMRMLLVLVAMVAAIWTASALSSAPGPLGTKEAQAATYTTIKGTAIKTDTNARVAGADVYLWRWNGSSWVNLGKKTTTNSYGNYAISNVATGYYYSVRGYKVYGSCFTGAAIYDGFSTTFYVPGTSTGVNAAIRMDFIQWFYC